MNEPDENAPPPKYKWPWFVLAAVILGIVLAVIWVAFAAIREKSERNFDAPLPVQSR